MAKPWRAGVIKNWGEHSEADTESVFEEQWFFSMLFVLGTFNKPAVAVPVCGLLAFLYHIVTQPCFFKLLQIVNH